MCWRSAAPSRSPLPRLRARPARAQDPAARRRRRHARARTCAPSTATTCCWSPAFAATRPRWSRRRSACSARGVPVIAITDSALSPLVALGQRLLRAGRRLVQAVPLAGGAAVPGAGAGGEHRPSAGREARAAGPRASQGTKHRSTTAVRPDLHGPRRGRPLRRADRRPAGGHADASASTWAARRPTPRSGVARLGLQAGDAHPRRRRAQRPLRARDAGRRRRRRAATSRPIPSASPRWCSSASRTARPFRWCSTATTAPTWGSSADDFDARLHRARPPAC